MRLDVVRGVILAVLVGGATAQGEAPAAPPPLPPVSTVPAVPAPAQVPAAVGEIVGVPAPTAAAPASPFETFGGFDVLPEIAEVPPPVDGATAPQGDEDVVGELRRAVERLRRASLTPADRRKAARELRRLADQLGGRAEATPLPALDRAAGERAELLDRLHAQEQAMDQFHEHLQDYAKLHADRALASAEAAKAHGDLEAARHNLEQAMVEQDRASARAADEHAAHAGGSGVARTHAADPRLADLFAELQARAEQTREVAAEQRAQAERAAARGQHRAALESFRAMQGRTAVARAYGQAPAAVAQGEAAEPADVAEEVQVEGSTAQLREMIDEMRAEMASVRALLEDLRARRGGTR